MVELKQKGGDFLLLFEAVQDIAELDSATAPTAVTLYQVKKKETGSWSWSSLTGTPEPKPPKAAKNAKPSTKSKKTTAPFSKVGDSILGKLHRSVLAFPSIAVEGYFISNVGCNIPLATGGNSATAMPHDLTSLDASYVALISNALSSLGAANAAPPDLSKLKLKTVSVHPNDLSSPVISAVLEMLVSKSPEHAPQARAFAEALVMKISPLGRHTLHCATFEDLVRERGFSKTDFDHALSELQACPDRLALLKKLTTQLQSEGLDVLSVFALEAQATRLAREQLTGITAETQSIYDFCDGWIAKNPLTANTLLIDWCADAIGQIKVNFNDCSNNELMARFLMRVVVKCVDPS